MSELEITFLGTGTSQGIPVIACDCVVCQSADPRDNRTRSSILISVNGENYVVDTGPDFRAQMLRENVKSLRAVLFTQALISGFSSSFWCQVNSFFGWWVDLKQQLRHAASALGMLIEKFGTGQVAAGFCHWKCQLQRKRITASEFKV